MIVTAIVPIGNVLYRCGYCVKPVDGVAAASFSVEQFSESLSRALTDFGSEFFWSTVIAWVAATMILTLAVVIGWLAIARSGWRYVLLLSIAISLTLPGPLVGVTISDLFATVQSSLLIWLYDRTIFAPVLATSIFCWPLAAMLVWYLFSRIDRDSLHSARLDGASWLRQLWHFGVLGNKSALAGAWLLTFALCFGELSATQLVLPPGMDTLPRLMLGLLHAGVDEMTAALTIVISGTVFVLSLLAYAAFRITFWHHT